MGVHSTGVNLYFLPIDRTYSVTASAIGYQSETREVTLTSEKPHVIQHFYLKETDEDKAVKQRVILNNDNGRIYGHTVSSFAWSWNPISNVLVTTGLQGKSTVSDGYYSISGLPLNVPIRITARKFGYYSDSKTVTLTNDDHEEYLILDLQQFLGKSKAKNIGLINDLFTLTSFSPNTRSNLFSTTAFVS